MNSVWFSIAVVCAIYLSQPIRCVDEMEDFPLDTDDETKKNALQQPPINQPNLDENSTLNEKVDLSMMTSAGGQVRLFNQIMMLAMKKPSAKQKLAQVLPIIRVMSPSQRLTLATLVLKQMMSKTSSQQQSNLELMAAKSDNRTSELMIPISLDIASIFNTVGKDTESGRSSVLGTYYYNPLSAGYRLNGPPHQRPPVFNIRRFHMPNSRRKDDVPPGSIGTALILLDKKEGKLKLPIQQKLPQVSPKLQMMPPPYSSSNVSYANFNKQSVDDEDDVEDSEEDDEDESSSGDSDKSASEDVLNRDCVPYINNLCLDVHLYPNKDILNSIRSLEQKHVFRALVEDFTRNVTVDSPEMERRHGSEENQNLHICASKVKYARPKKAKSMHGSWKFVVNTERYTQTVRIETCLNADKACSYLNDNVKSHCAQIYNYHRLLTWDEKSGLSLDLFKIPSCCACQIQHVTPFTNTKKYSQKPDVGLQDNVIVEESKIFHPSISKPKSKNKPNGPLVPKRDNFGRPRRPSSVLPIHQEGNERGQHPPQSSQSNRYSPSDNAIRRASSKTNPPKGVFVAGKGTLMENTEVESTTSTHRVNYNYHPIIDFFKPAQQPQPLPSPEHQKIEREDVMDDWLPITEGPRALHV